MFNFLTRLGRLFIGIIVVAALASVIGIATLTSSFTGAKQSSTATMTLVLENSTDGLPHYGQTVTFQVATNATSQPNVSLDCYQAGKLVYGAVSGFYPSYPWPGTQNFILSSPSWTGGAASCTAKMYYFSGKKTVTLKTLGIQVYA